MSKQSMLQIPNNIVRNGEISSVEFVLLLKLKQLSYLNGNNAEYIVDTGKLKSSININDNRTFKKCLSKIYEYGFLNQEAKILRNQPMEIKLNIEMIKEKPFTQLPTSILDKMGKIEYVGIRLLYYYESYIVRSDMKKQFCFAGMDTIENNTGISRKTIIKYNEILVTEKMLKIEKHKLGTEYQYNNNDQLLFDKYNNHYKVKIENI